VFSIGVKLFVAADLVGFLAGDVVEGLIKNFVIAVKSIATRHWSLP
jgi:hypothetical protein